MALALVIGGLYYVYVGPIYQMLHVQKGGVEEMLSVPLQQMARTYNYKYDSLEESKRELLEEFVPKEALSCYKATVSDPIKSKFNAEYFKENKGAFFKLWASWGGKYPVIYINSFLISTVDTWYPGAVMDGYRFWDGRGSWFDYKVSEPGEEVVLLPYLHEFYERMAHDVDFQKDNFLYLFLSPGWYLSCTVVFFFYFWSRKKYQMLIPMVIFGAHLLTILLGPMSLVRYMLIFYYALPIWVALVIWGRFFDCGTARI